MKISVIIPALNEAHSIEGAITSALMVSGGELIEIIVVDGGSSDDTPEISLRLGASLINSPSGRGLQMDKGAAMATGEILLFLHADTRLPRQWTLPLLKALADPGVVGGAYNLSIDAPGWSFRLLEQAANLRSRHLKLIYGDQGIFIRKKIFNKIGGFMKLPLMEEVDCVKRLRVAGEVVLLDEYVSTSPRRWLKGGIVKNSVRNWYFLLLYKVGFSAERLYRYYYK